MVLEKAGDSMDSSLLISQIVALLILFMKEGISLKTVHFIPQSMPRKLENKKQYWKSHATNGEHCCTNQPVNLDSTAV